MLVLLSIPLICRWVPRNRLYGFRTAATLSRDDIWYEVNALSGWHMVILGGIMVALEFVLPSNLRVPVLRTVGFAGVAVILVCDWRIANRLRRERENR